VLREAGFDVDDRAGQHGRRCGWCRAGYAVQPPLPR
jgi:hypothetical protein